MPRKTSSAPLGDVVIGAGIMGGFHAETVARLKRANLIAVVDPAEKQAKAAARRLGCLAFANADEALAQPEVEAVIIVTLERIQSVRAGTPRQPSLDEALSSLRVADAIQRSLKSGIPMVLPA